jgi:hypothetical protein
MTTIILVTEHKQCRRCNSVYTIPAGIFIELSPTNLKRFRRRILVPASPENLPNYLVTHQHAVEEVHTSVTACQSCFFPSTLQPDLLTILEPTPAEIIESQAINRGAFTLSDFLPSNPTEH